ncbi:MAG: hypothetical protein V5A62_19295 [Haloarculaceae archaeon]
MTGTGREEGWWALFAGQYWAAWVLSGVGLALAGPSLWYLIVVKAFYIGTTLGSGPTALVLSVIEVGLLAAGGGAIGGLLVGVSTVWETAGAEQVKQQRDTLLFVNEILRHNVLNGMQVVLGNTGLLREHTDRAGQPLLATNERRAETVVELVQNVRTLVRSVSGEVPCGAVPLSSVPRAEVASIRTTHPSASVRASVCTWWTRSSTGTAGTSVSRTTTRAGRSPSWNCRTRPDAVGRGNTT